MSGIWEESLDTFSGCNFKTKELSREDLIENFSHFITTQALTSSYSTIPFTPLIKSHFIIFKNKYQ